MKKSINIQHIQFGALIAVLLLATVMLTTIGAVQAQNITSTVLPSLLPAQDSISTPATSALDSSGSNDESLAGDANDNSNSNADETTSSSGSADDGNNNDDSDSQKMQHQVMAMMATLMKLPVHLDLLTTSPITPSPETSDGDSESSSSGDSDNNGSNDDSSGSSGSADDDNNSKIVTHNKMQHQVMATAVAQKIQH